MSRRAERGAGGHLRQSVAEKTTNLMKRKSQGKHIHLTTRTGYTLGQELRRNQKEVGAGWDEVKQVVGIAVTRTGIIPDLPLLVVHGVCMLGWLIN